MLKAWCTAMAGWCAAECGDSSRGIAQVTEAIAALRATQSQSFMPYLLGLMADACTKVGRFAEAMTAVEEAIAIAEATGERFYSAELYRLHGDLCAQPHLGRKREAEASLRTAVKIAKQQGAHVLARKASESLRCWAE
jgi:predicted ATPase